MIKYFSVLIVSVAVFSSCKKANDHTTTKVGFYYSDKTAGSSDNTTYNLYVDNEYKGKIHSIQNTPSCGDSMLFYLTLDSKKHELEVKNDAGELLNSEYLQISEKKCGSGSGKNSKKVKDGSHGSSYSKKNGDDCATMCFTR